MSGSTSVRSILTSQSDVAEPVLRYAALSDLVNPEYRTAFAELEACQRCFFEAQGLVLGSDYPWPRQPLYDWSRRVEYPFAVDELREAPGPRVLDVGTGVTFFPGCLSQHYNLRLQCVDIHPDYPVLMERINRMAYPACELPYDVGNAAEQLPWLDGAFDAVMCLSVLEHIPDAQRGAILTEIWRLVAPGGRLIITCDIDLANSDDGIPLNDVPALIATWNQILGKLPPLPKTLQDDILTTRRPGYGVAPLRVDLDETIITSGWRARWLKWQNSPWLGLSLNLACLLCAVSKPAIPEARS